MGSKRDRNKLKLVEKDVAYTSSFIPESPEVEHVLHVLSNDPQAWKYDLLQMLLEGVMTNAVGYMDARHAVTNEPHRLLVGLELDSNGAVNAYPLARLLEPDEIADYIAPDGKGGWADDNVAKPVL